MSQRSQRLVEAAPKSRPGTLVGWRTPGGFDYGVVIGSEGKDLLCLTMFDKRLRMDTTMRTYRDEELSDRLSAQTLVPGVMMDVHRIPMQRAFVSGRMVGPALRMYMQTATDLQTEDYMENVNSTLGKIRRELSEKMQGIRESADSLGRPETQHMKYGTRYTYRHGIFIDHDADKGQFVVSQAGSPKSKRLGVATSLAGAKKIALKKGDLKEAALDEMDIMDAEEKVAEHLQKAERASGAAARKHLAAAMKIMKKSGLDKEKDWMAQYNMRAKSVGESSTIESINVMLSDIRESLEAR